MFFVTSVVANIRPQAPFATYHGLERGEEVGCPEDVVTTKTRRRNGEATALKGQCHDIFDFWFFHELVSPKPLSNH
jgi:hypothetical protein